MIAKCLARPLCSADLTAGDLRHPLPPVLFAKRIRMDFLLFELRHSVTYQAHADLMNTELLKQAGVSIGVTPDALKAEAWRYFEEAGLSVIKTRPSSSTLALSHIWFRQVVNVAPPGKEPVPLFSLKKCLRLWLLHPDLSRVVVDCSERNTAPFMPFIAEHADDTTLPPDFERKIKGMHRHMSDGSEWLEPFRRTAAKWKPLLASGRRLLFLHLLLFGDGMQLWKRRQQSFEVITSTLGEFDEGLRASTRSPAIQLNLIASHKNQLEVFGGSTDRILELFLPELDELASGVEFWCEHLKCVTTVVAVFHGQEGDMPDRYKKGGCRCPVNCDGEACPVCPETRHSLRATIEHTRDPAVRPVGYYRQLIAKYASSTVYDQAFRQASGLSRISALHKFPGFALERQLLLELMHLQAEGELVKHYEKFAALLEQHRVRSTAGHFLLRVIQPALD